MSFTSISAAAAKIIIQDECTCVGVGNLIDVMLMLSFNFFDICRSREKWCFNTQKQGEMNRL